MRSTPRLTVITPVFNGEKFIEETIKSVLEHSKNQNIEYLVIDDGSQDSTNLILEKYSHSLRVIRQKNLGESSAVNSGIFQASGDFLLVVNADDPLFTPLIFSDVCKFFDENVNVVAWYPNWQMIDGRGNFIRQVIVPDYSDENLIGKFMCLPGPGTFFRRTTALKISGRNTRWKFVGDYDFWLRLSREGTLRKRDQTLAQWRMHETSLTSQNRGLEMYYERINVIKDFILRNNLDSNLKKMALAHAYYYAAQLCYFSPRIPARRSLLKSFFIRRGWPEAARKRTILFILLLPFSRLLKPLIVKIMRKSIND